MDLMYFSLVNISTHCNTGSVTVVRSPVRLWSGNSRQCYISTVSWRALVFLV